MNLLNEITHCPNVKECLANPNPSHPCYKIVQIQKQPWENFQVPEPWNGHLEKAPILFLSSNPSISESEEYPLGCWTEDQITDFFENRFGGGKKQWVKDGIHGLQKSTDDQPSHGKATHFWVEVRERAKELLEKDVSPGEDYALSELVHCKSLEEEGVIEALEECTKRYFEATTRLSGVRIIVVLGSKAREIVKGKLGIPANVRLFGPEEVFGRKRLVVFMPHPSSFGQRSFAKCLVPEELETLRNFLR
jgi:hypothetical protein